jgi:predicted negative regulator of RcsB-dependent stress response
MAKKPSSSRARREDAGPDDAFVTAIKKSYAWGQENSRVLTIGLAVALVAVAAGVWYISQQRQLEDQAAARFAQVQQTVAAGNPQLAIRDLRQYIDRFGGTRTADQARLLLANILLGQGQAEDAITAIGDIHRDLDASFGLAGARLHAAALEELGRIDDAVDTYLRIADNARFPYQRREALADAARAQLQNGSPEQAAALYQRVVDSLEEDSPQASYYAMWLAEARAQAERGVAVSADDNATDTAGQ